MADVQGNSFPVLKNDLILRTIRGENVERVPVWMMRQAGRYLPEFRQLRVEHDFFKVCKTPELACQVTLQPIERYPVDAAIIFSDILVVCEALGMKVEMVPGKGPSFPQPLQDPDDIQRLKTDVDVRRELKYVMDAITLTRHRLDGRVPLIGFSGAPWTLMAYMIDGEGSKTFSKAKRWLYSHGKESTQLLTLITNVVTDYLVAQAEAGAQMLMLFESHAEVLNLELFSLFSLPYLRSIANNVKAALGSKSVPMVVFAKGAYYGIGALSDTAFDVIGLDWTISPKEARLSLPTKTLMGNLDPCALYASEEDIVMYTKSMLTAFGKNRYIANLGHGIYPDVDPKSAGVFLDAVHRLSEEQS